VAKQADPAAQYNGYKNDDSEMKLPAYQNEWVRHLAAATALALCE